MRSGGRFAIAFGFCLAVGCTKPTPPDPAKTREQVLAQLEKLGGRVESGDPGQPIVAIDLGGVELTDADLLPLQALAATPAVLVDRLNELLFAYQMSVATRTRLLQMLGAMPAGTDSRNKNRLKAALIVTALSPDFVIQK